MKIIIFAGLILQLILQANSAWLTWKVYWTNNRRHPKFWRRLAASFVFMTIRRVTAILSMIGIPSVCLLDKLLLPLIISILQRWGISDVIKERSNLDRQLDERTRELKRIQEERKKDTERIAILQRQIDTIDYKDQ